MAKSGQRTSHIRQPVHLSGTTTIGTPSSPAASTPLGQKAMQIPQPLHQLVNTACGRPPTLVWSFTEPFVLAGAARALAAVAPGSRAAEVPLTSPWGVSGSATAAPIPPGCPAFEETVFAGSSSLSFGNTTPPRGARRIAVMGPEAGAIAWLALPEASSNPGEVSRQRGRTVRRATRPRDREVERGRVRFQRRYVKDLPRFGRITGRGHRARLGDTGWPFWSIERAAHGLAG